MHTNLDDAPILIGQSGPLNGEKWNLFNKIIIGRETSCDIVIPNRQVSRQHIVLTPAIEGIYLEDLNSKNGTHLNGQLITDKILLQDGDLIQIAFVQEFIFVSADGTLPLGEITAILPADSPPKKLRLQLQKNSRRVWVGDTELFPPLSVAQFRLLEILYEQEGRVVPKQSLTMGIWGEKGALEVTNQALDALIRRLRDRLALLEIEHNYIVTVRGHGLRLDNPTNED